MFRYLWEQHTHKKYQNVLKLFFTQKMSVDIKVISVDEKFGKDILKLQGYILYIFQPFRFLRLWLYPVTTIIKGIIYLLTSVMQVISNQ